MENKAVNVNNDAEARQRFHSFKLGKGFPSTFSNHKPPHSRSHSRNISVSSTSSLSRPTVTSSDDIARPSDSGSSPGQGLTPSTKRNSHHRRRSSVSTRRESAEMMGISLPDLPPLTEDGSNLGEKDSIRRRALWALEGKPDVSYSKVEIPELSTSQMEKIMSEFPSVPSFSSSSGMISNKRDSFKLLSSVSSAKDHLHTLVEEEEEEEEEGSSSNPMGPKAAEHLATPQRSSLTVKPTMNRPRPASLNLRPLSLTPETVSISVGQPQPAFSRSTVHGGLKSLSLTSSVTCEQSSSFLSYREPRSQSFVSPSRSSSIDNKPPSTEDSKPRRRSSIPYKTSSDVVTNSAGLPTPGITPNYQEQRFSWSESLKNSSEDVFFLPSPAKKRPLSASEQCFLLKSYGTLLARIAELERALSARISPPYSQRTASISSDVSFSSDQTGTTLGESSDEVLQLIADLKSERDEYKKDIDAWRVRVHDMDNKIAMMTKRVEVERREAWLARSRISLLEAEKASLEKKLECSEASLTMVQEEKSALEVKNQDLQDEMEQVHADLIQVRQLLGQAQQEIKDMKRPKIVAADLTDEDDAFAQCDEESDISFQTSSSNSIDEPSGVLFALNYLASDVQTAAGAVQGHASKDSLSKSWTFPTGAVIEPCKAEANVDNFFGCLEVVEDEANALLFTDPSEYSYERSKGLFSEALKSFCDDQDAPFFPGVVSINEDGTQTVAGLGNLSTVMEEEEHLVSENDEGMLGEAGGICITLTPAQDDDDECEDDVFITSPSDPPVLPPLNFDHNVEELRNALSFNFSYYDISETLAAGSRSPTPKATSANSSPIHRLAFPNSALGTNVSPQFSTSRPFQSTQRWSTDICTHTNLPSFTNGLTSIPQPCVSCRRS
ncbi:hypothetical protein APHAL10511_002033 [Amanita phalloides]|nr:hypothetical protein APHAL10511_002033 [Amanita phalloides]